MSGLRRRLIAFADTVRAEHADQYAALLAAELRVWLDELPTIMMLNDFSSQSTFEWVWNVGLWDTTYDRTFNLVRSTTVELSSLGDYGQAEVGASLLDELSTGAELSSEPLEYLRKQVDDAKRKGLTLGGLVGLYFAGRIALAVLERR